VRLPEVPWLETRFARGLRWVVLVPVTVVIAVLARAISLRVNIWVAVQAETFAGLSVASWVISALASGLTGFVLVVVPARIAPARTGLVACVTAAIVALVEAAVAVAAWLQGDPFTALDAAVVACSAGLTAVALRDD
jgi:hypothetical protein